MPIRRTVGLASLATVAVAAAEPRANELDERLARGEVSVVQLAMEGFAIPALQTDFVLDAPPEAAFALIDDCAGYPKVMPHVEVAAETRREGDHSTCTWTVDMPFPLQDLSTEVGVNRTRTGTTWTREFKQTSGQFTRNEGRWTVTRFHDDPNRARVSYWLFVVMDSPLPDVFVKTGQKGAMGDMVKNLRRSLAARRGDH